MNSKLTFIFLLIFFLPLASCLQPLTDVQDIQADLKEYTGLDLSENDVDKIIVVEGSNLNLLEKTALKMAYNEYPALRDAAKVADDVENLDDLRTTDKIIVFIGGPSQNNLAQTFLDERNESEIKEYALTSGVYEEGIVILSDKRGFSNLEREAAKNSLLNRFMPVEYVPVGAAGISVLLLIFIDLITSFIEGKIERHGKSKEIKEKFIGFSLGNYHFRFREILSVLLGAFVFALAISWTFTGNAGGLTRILGISILACACVFVIQEIPRMRISGKKGTVTEFIFYPLGAGMTLLSAFLGNVFGNPGKWIFKHKEYSGKIYYTMMLSIFILSIILFFVNVVRPSVFLQIGMVATSTLSAFEFLPFKPLNGREIFKWRPKLWTITFILIVPTYILINFVL